MKKAILLIGLLISSVSAALAVPPGSYVDNRGRVKAIVHQNGKEIYLINREGKVYMTFEVISEDEISESKGTFVVRDIRTEFTQRRNSYWVENGVLRMNLEALPSTVNRE